MQKEFSVKREYLFNRLPDLAVITPFIWETD
jgi:hypothetical protein